MAVDGGAFEKLQCIGADIGHHIVDPVVAAGHSPDNRIHLSKQLVGRVGDFFYFGKGIVLHFYFTISLIRRMAVTPEPSSSCISAEMRLRSSCVAWTTASCFSNSFRSFSSFR